VQLSCGTGYERRDLPHSDLLNQFTAGLMVESERIATDLAIDTRFSSRPTERPVSAPQETTTP